MVLIFYLRILSRFLVLFLTLLWRGSLTLIRSFPEPRVACLNYIICVSFWIVCHVCIKFSSAHDHVFIYCIMVLPIYSFVSIGFALTPCTVFLSSGIRLQHTIGLICKLLDGEGQGNLQTFCPHFASYITRRSFRLSILDNHAKDYRLAVPGNSWSLDHFLHSWHISAVNIWNTLPAFMLTDGIKWLSGTTSWGCYSATLQKLLISFNYCYKYSLYTHAQNKGKKNNLVY